MYFASLIQRQRSSDPVIGVDICKYDEGSGDTCEMAVSLTVKGSQDVFMYGAGFYSFFNAWSQDCIKSCQAELFSIVQSRNIYLYVISVYGGEFMTVEKTANTTTMTTIEESSQMHFLSTCVVDLRFSH